MLQAYALAHLSKRFSFKSLKAKNVTSSWIYVPQREANLTDAAFKVVGNDIVSRCMLVSRSSSCEVVALLPKADTGNYFIFFNPSQKEQSQ